MDDLARSVKSLFLHSGTSDDRDIVALTRARHYDAIVKAESILQRVIKSQMGLVLPELLAIELRDVLSVLGCITGETTTDDLLDIIFHLFV